MASDQTSFRNSLILEEFKAARERISKEIDVMNTLETTFVLAAGAITAFSLVNYTVILFRASMFLIVLIAMYGYYRYQMHRKIVRIHETYVEEKIEPALTQDDAPSANGLVAYYNKMKSKRIDEIGSPTTSGGLKKARIRLWFVLGGLPLFAFILTFCDPTLFGILKH